MTSIHFSGPSLRPESRLAGTVVLSLAALFFRDALAAEELPTREPDVAQEGSPDKPPATPPATPARPKRDLEGAIGLLASYSPEYPGASANSIKFRPAGFLRWGRFTVTGAGGFTTRRNDEVERGLGAELVRHTAFRLKLGLRMDGGRSESDSPRLAGMGDIKQTVRARLLGQWDFGEGWRLGAAISLDTLNQGGGYVVDAAVAHEWKLPRDATFTLSAGVVGAGDRFMQTWHGVTPEQSARSGLPVYQAAEGLRNVVLSAVWRGELSPRWAAFVGGNLTHLVGSAAASPLTGKATSSALSGGLVWRF